jgi:hypothetical protein
VRPPLAVAALLGALLAAAACDARAHEPPTLRVTILGDAADPRLPAVREALAHWNATAARLGLRVRFDSGTVVGAPLPEPALRAASATVARGGAGVGVLRLRAALADVPGDVVVALPRAPIVSFGATTGTGRTGVIGLRPTDRWPLSLPNAARNVAAHELGHLLGLAHNADSTTLMCGRPAPCRPSAFASDAARFFPLTAADERRLRGRWR